MYYIYATFHIQSIVVLDELLQFWINKWTYFNIKKKTLVFINKNCLGLKKNVLIQE